MADLEIAGKRYSSRLKSLIFREDRADFRRMLMERFTTLSIVFAVLIIWETLSRLGLASKIIFPAPSTISKEFVKDLLAGAFTQDFLITITRISAGLFFGSSLGMLLGMIMGWNPTARRIIDPIVAFIHPIPKMTLLPMVLIILGLGEESRIFMIAMGGFFPMVVNTMFGVRQINPIYYDVVDNYGGSKWDEFRRVVLPGSLPYIISGLRLSFKMALTTGIGIEMVYGTTGLGANLWLAWETMRMWKLYSIIFIIAMVGALVTWALELLNAYLLPWHHEANLE